MSYTIQAMGDKFVMNGVEAKFIVDHLFKIAEDSGFTYIQVTSESHLLHDLQEHGIVVNLLDEDGSKIEW